MRGPFTRRAALRGTAAAALGLAAGAAPTLASAAPHHPDDARLIDNAAAAEALERACDTFTAEHRGRETDATEEAFGDLCRGFGLIEQEIAATPAATMHGVLAKARAAQVATMRAFDACPFGASIADDLVRLFGRGTA